MGRNSYNSSSSASSTASADSSTRSKGSSKTAYSNSSSSAERRVHHKHTQKARKDQAADERRYREASVVTYASTDSSDEDGDDASEADRPRLRRTIYAADAVPASPPDFAELFPSTRKLLIRHDDTTADGNMNLRIDTEIRTTKGRRVNMTLFHLRLNSLIDRKFSLRRYCRESGREVCHSSRKYEKLGKSETPRRPGMPRSLTTVLRGIGKPNQQRRHHESGYESDDDADEDLLRFTALSEVKATIPTDTIRLEFSNYAQVELHRCSEQTIRGHVFEYWGVPYHWQTPSGTSDSYRLIDMSQDRVIAQIHPIPTSKRQRIEDELEGSWVPPSSLEIVDRSIASEGRADLADVIVATGLLSLVDDNVKYQRPRLSTSHAQRASTTTEVPRSCLSYTKVRR